MTGPVLTVRSRSMCTDDYHQQYLSDSKNPNGYCGIGGTGLSCPVGVAPVE